MHTNPKKSGKPYFFAFLGSLNVKAARKMLMKLTPGVGLYVGRLVREYIGYVIFLAKEYWRKSCS